MKRETTVLLIGCAALLVAPSTGTAYLEEVFPAPPGPSGYSSIFSPAFNGLMTRHSPTRSAAIEIRGMEGFLRAMEMRET